ncbi:MAG: hypothetical protein A2Y06_00155 [Omnitrophica WOR_2 bacterium GWA2_37_7]|nr:MAG: hypothetical protein A2Y06_00155 [Omnitrophica WOR_2 bacterium GWA2_37_7]
MKKNIITSVEITDSHIKVLQSKILKGKTVVCSCDIHSIREHSDEEIEHVLVAVFEDKKILTEDIVLVISRRLAFVKYMRLPSNNDVEIKKMIGLQLVNNMPYSQDEILFKPYILERERSGYTKLLVLIVQKEIVSRYLKLFEKVGIVLSQVTLSSIGILNWFIYQESENRKKIKDAVILVNIDVLHSEICFCCHDRLFFSRSVNYGSNDLSEGKIESLVEQICLSIDAYKKENMGPDIGRLKIVSDLPQASSFKDRLEDALKIEVAVIAPFTNVLCQKNMHFAGIKNFTGISLAVGLGLILSDIRGLVNFTPQEVHDNKEEKLRRMKWIRTLALFILAFSLLSGIFGLELYQKKLYLEQLKKRINEAAPEVRAAIDKKLIVEVLDKELKSRVFIPDLIDEIYDLTPEMISYRSLFLTGDNVFTAQGFSESGSSVNDLRANMVKSRMFKEVNLQFATKRKLYKVEVIDFKITAVLDDREQD